MKDLMEVVGLLQMIRIRLGSVALCFLATSERIDAMSKIDWDKGSASHREAKDRMKEVSASVGQCSIILHENSLLSLAKVIEDTSIDLKRSSQRFKFHYIKDHHDIAFLKEVQAIVSWANVIKHNQSRVVRCTSEASKYLVDHCGVINESSIESLVLEGDPIVDIVTYIPQVFIAMMELVEKSHGFRAPILDEDFPDAANNIYDSSIPDILGIAKPKFTDSGPTRLY